MRFCCREITINGADLKVYPSGKIFKIDGRSGKWTCIKGTSLTKGHLQTEINFKKISHHRIVAHAYFGFDLSSPLMIDHRDRNPKNNAVWNLRIVNPQENVWNNSYKGIWKDEGGIRTSIYIDKKPIQKRFKTEEEALAWRKEMKAIHYKITEPDYKHIMSQCLRNI